MAPAAEAPSESPPRPTGPERASPGPSVIVLPVAEAFVAPSMPPPSPPPAPAPPVQEVRPRQPAPIVVSGPPRDRIAEALRPAPAVVPIPDAAVPIVRSSAFAGLRSGISKTFARVPARLERLKGLGPLKGAGRLEGLGRLGHPRVVAILGAAVLATSLIGYGLLRIGAPSSERPEPTRPITAAQTPAPQVPVPQIQPAPPPVVPVPTPQPPAAQIPAQVPAQLPAPAIASPGAPPPVGQLPASPATPARPAEPGAVRGVAEVVDTGTLRIGGRVVRLFGVEWTRGGEPVELSNYLRGREVACLPAGQIGSSRCAVDGQDLSRVVLFNGGGRATQEASPDLVAAEEHARQARIGVWRR